MTEVLRKVFDANEVADELTAVDTTRATARAGAR